MTTLRSFQAEIENFSHEKQRQAIAQAREAHAAAEQAKHHGKKHDIKHDTKHPAQPTSPVKAKVSLDEQREPEEDAIPVRVEVRPLGWCPAPPLHPCLRRRRRR